jgi:DNA-binding NtrC family response regulator
VRQLENTIERAVVLSDQDTIEPTAFADALATSAPAPAPAPVTGTLDDAVSAAERAAITAALGAEDGNRRAAAKRLGVSLRTLFYKMTRYGIS